MKIKQSDLKSLKKEGVTVRRSMGKQKDLPSRSTAPTKEVEPPKEKVERSHASMAASMSESRAHLEAATQILARNGEIIKEFAESVKELKPLPASPYTFKLRRDEDKLLERVFAIPGIVED